MQPPVHPDPPDPAAVLDAVFDSARDLFIVIDRELRVRASNWKGLPYLSAAQREGHPHCYACFMQRDEPCPSCPARKVFETGQADRFERTNPVDGSRWDIQAVPIRNADGRITHVVERVRDTTERLRQQRALKESESLYRGIFDAANDAIFLVEGHRFVDCNPMTLQMFGARRRSEIIGRSPAEFSPRQQPDGGDSAAAAASRIEAAVAGRPQRFSWRHRRLDGTDFDAEVSLSRIDIAGRVFTQAIVRDISFRLKAERHSREMQSKLQHAVKMEAVGTLAGGVAHDFNNILQAIRGYTELLQQHGAALPDGDGRKIEEILHLADRGGELVQQLLTFSRKVETRKRPLDLNQQVENARRMLVRTIPKMIAIQTRLAPDIDIVEADAAQLQRVLVNLALNARDAMPEGGTMRITTANAALDEAFCRVHTGARPGRHVRLDVSDTGRGMPPEILDRIFEPFFTTKPRGKGTGLGMAIVYGLVKDHGGYIDCRSAPDQGTRFRIYLPSVETGEPAETGETTAAPPPAGGSETILVVDDEASLLEIAQEILSNFGYRVLTAPDGETALDLYRRRLPEIALVVLDLIMPGMGGRRCLRALKEIDPDAPVIVSSGYSTDAERKEIDALGAAGFIGKPYNLQALLREVRRVLDA